MTISLLIVAGLTDLVVHNSRATAELDRTSRQIENGRYAMSILQDEIKLAGFWGELLGQLPQSSITFTMPDPCATALTSLGFDNATSSVPLALQGYAAASATPACVASRVANTSALVLRRVASATTAPAAVTGGNAYLQTSRCNTDPTNIKFIFDTSASAFTFHTLDCSALTAVRQYVSRLYYIASCDDCGNDSIPTLKRVDFVNGATQVTPIAEGVQELQFEYGFDTNGDGAPDVFLTGLDGVVGSPSNTWANVTAVRIWMMSRTTEATQGYTDTKTYSLGVFGPRGPYNDGFKRRVYSALVHVYNVADPRG